MKFDEFKKKMNKADTLADGDNLIAQLSAEQLTEIVQTLEKCKEFTGITMRDEYVLSMAKIFLEKPETMKYYTKKYYRKVVV